MKELNKVYFFLKYGNLSASTRHRFIKFFDVIKKIYKVEYYILLDNYYFKKKIITNNNVYINILYSFLKRVFHVLTVKRNSKIVIQGELFPYLPNILERILIYKKCKIIYDLDDAFFHKYDHLNFLLKNKFDFIFKKSCMIFAGSNYIKNFANKKGAKNIKLLPTSIDLERYDSIKQKKNKQFSIVWIGSPSTTFYLNLIIDILNDFQNNNSRVILIGANKKNIIKKNNFEYYNWNYKNEVNLIKKCHVGIMPLLNNKWEKGKCGFKILQYFGSKIPAIATPVGENKIIIDHNLNGFHAKTPEDWRKFLDKSRKNFLLLNKMGLNGYNKVKKNYSIEKNKYLFRDYLINN